MYLERPTNSEDGKIKKVVYDDAKSGRVVCGEGDDAKLGKVMFGEGQLGKIVSGEGNLRKVVSGEGDDGKLGNGDGDDGKLGKAVSEEGDDGKLGKVVFEEEDAELIIEKLDSDVIGLILQKLPCTDRYRLYSLLRNSELKKTVESVFSRRLTLRYEFSSGTVTCEEEGFKCWKVDLSPIIWLDWVFEAYGTCVTWSSSGGLVAAIVDRNFQQQEVNKRQSPHEISLDPVRKASLWKFTIEQLQQRFTIVVTNVVTGSSRTVDMPRLRKGNEPIGFEPREVHSILDYVSIVLDCDPWTQTYKVVIAENEYICTSAKATIHVYSSQTGTWEKHSKIFKDSMLYIMNWHAVRSGFLHFSSRGSSMHLFYTLNMADMSSPHTEKTIYHKWSLDPQSGIDILRPAIFTEDYIVAFGSETWNGPLDLLEWDATNGWCKVSRLPMGKVMKFLSNCTNTVWPYYVRTVTFHRGGNKVGMMLLDDPDYGLEYDMDSKHWECIFDPGLRAFTDVYPSGVSHYPPDFYYLHVSSSLVHV